MEAFNQAEQDLISALANGAVPLSALTAPNPYLDTTSAHEPVAGVSQLTPAAGGVKFDAGKPRFELLSDCALREMARVLTFGAKKYDAHNWRQGLEWERVYGAAKRHLSDWHEGQQLDAETGLQHLAHAAVNLMFLIEFELKGLGVDNRWVGHE